MKILINMLKIIIGITAVIITIIGLSILINIILLRIESKKIVPNGILVEVNGNKLHIYTEGNKNSKPSLVFLAGNGTPAPVYDFKPLYSLLKDEYHIIIVEKIGYGYADIKNIDRDIDAILNDTRQALQSLGYNGSYILFPHSMSGLEALYWKAKYPEEITAITGLDMSFPECYDIRNVINEADDKRLLSMKLFHYAVKTGILRISFVTSGLISINNPSLTEDEHQQAKYLLYRNGMNIDILNEAKKVHSNARNVSDLFNYNENINMLLFSSNGEGLNESWVEIQKEIAVKTGSQLIIFDCGHSVHIHETQVIAEKCKEYLNEIL